MPQALEVLTGTVTAPGGAATALTMASGNSATIRNAALNTRIYLLQLWADFQAVGQFRVRSPKLHDNVQGMRWDVTIGDVAPLLPWGVFQRLIAQDALTLDINTASGAGVIETASLLIWYEDLPGSAARLINSEELGRRGVNVVTVENTLSLGTAGGYSAEEAINAEFDLLKANTDYALVGYTVDAEFATVRWRGADTANLGVGGPGNETLRHVTSTWFKRLSEEFAMALIPVFNSANRAGILVDGAQDNGGTDSTVTSIFVELAPGGAAAPAVR